MIYIQFINSQDSMQFEKMINTIEFAQKTNTTHKLNLETLQQIQFRL